MGMKKIAFLLLMALAACQPDKPDGPPDTSMSAADRAECEAAGGSVGRGGLLPDEICYKPTPDAGKACKTADDCSGFCLAETMTCSKVTPQFGCFDFIDAAGAKQSICVD